MKRKNYALFAALFALALLFFCMTIARTAKNQGSFKVVMLSMFDAA
jgi:hypothetical protein